MLEHQRNDLAEAWIRFFIDEERDQVLELICGNPGLGKHFLEFGWFRPLAPTNDQHQGE